MDNFKEEIAVRRNTGLYNFMYFLSWVMMAISLVLGVIGLQSTLSMAFSGSFNLFPVLLLVLFGGSAFLLWKYKDNLRTEYEYTFTNGDLDVSKVLNNNKRKYLTSVNMKSVEAAGPVNTPAFERYLSMSDVKKHNWFLNREAKLYYYYFTKNAIKHLIVIELSEEMAELTHKANYMGFGVWQA